MGSDRGGRASAKAEKIPGTAALNTGGNAGVSSVSCIAASCAGGWYLARARTRMESGFLVIERRGSWGTAAKVPGLAALNTGGEANVTAVSCARSGWCAAVGDYANRASGETRMFVVNEH